MSNSKGLVDFGAKIGGARKDLRGSFAVSDVEGLTDIERKKLVRKDVVWPTPDYVEMFRGGVERNAVAALKMLRDSIPSAPIVPSGASEEDFRAACEQYVSVVNVIRNAVKPFKTQAELAASLKASEELRVKVGELVSAAVQSHDRSIPVITWRGRREAFLTTGAFKETGFPFSTRSAIAAACFAVQLEELDYDSRRALSKNPDWPDGTSRVASLIRRARLSFSAASDGKFYLGNYSGTIRAEDRSFYSKQVWAPLVGMPFDTAEAGTEALTKAIGEVESAKRAELRKKRDAVLRRTTHDGARDARYRIGPDYRSGGPVGPEAYLHEFAFRGGEFGNWVSQVERQQVLDRGYDALCDLARILKLERNQISLGGHLAIAFGARGKGGVHPAAAHYEPGRTVINLTKPHGEGVLAHEWAHALDHFLGNRARALGMKIHASEHGVYFLSECSPDHLSLDDVQPQHTDEARGLIAVRRAMEVIFTKEVPVDHAKQEAVFSQARTGAIDALRATHKSGVSYARGLFSSRGMLGNELEAAVETVSQVLARVTQFSTLPSGDEIAAVTSDLRKLAKGAGHWGWLQHDLTAQLGNVRHYDTLITEVRSRGPQPWMRTRSSDYARMMAVLDRELEFKKPYYALRREMFARGFEATVDDRLAAERQVSPYLQMSTDAAAYPAGAEREAIRNVLVPTIVAYAQFLPKVTPALAANRKPTEEEPGGLAMAAVLGNEEQTSLDLTCDQLPAEAARAIIPPDVSIATITSLEHSASEARGALDTYCALNPSAFVAALHGGWFHFSGPLASSVARALMQMEIGVAEARGHFSAYLENPTRVIAELRNLNLHAIVFPSPTRMEEVLRADPNIVPVRKARVTAPSVTRARTVETPSFGF